MVSIGLAVAVAALWWKVHRDRSLIDAASEISDLSLPTVLDQTDALLWEGMVNKDSEGYHWEFRLRESSLSRRLFPLYGKDPNRRFALWTEWQIPEIPEMNRRSQKAFETGANGYRQEFRLRVDSATVWLRESVTIQRLSDTRFRCVGLVVDITDQRAAEQARRNSERSLKELLTRADCLLWRATVRLGDGKYIWSDFEMPKSVLYEKLFGDRPVMMGQKLWSLIDTPELEQMNKRSNHALMTGKPGYEQVFPVLNAERVHFWLHETTSITPIGENLWHLVGVITDISDRRAAEITLRRSEARYRTLFEHTPVAIVEADFTAVGRWLDELRGQGVTDLAAYLEQDPREVSRGAMRVHLLQANEAARTMAGARSSAEMRWRRQLMETPSSLRAVQGIFLELWEGRYEVEREMDTRRFDGELRRFAMRWRVSKTDQGHDLAQSVMIFVDLTEIKRVQSDLAAQREQLAVTLRSMKEGVVSTDIAGRVRFINPAAQSMLGIEERDAVAQPLLRVCKFVSAKDGTPLGIPVERVASGDEVFDLPDDSSLHHGDNRVRLIEGQLAPVHDSESEVRGMVLVFRDITDRDRLEKELVRATRLESIGVLAGGIAHDFNNILTAVVGNISIAQLEADATTELGRLLREAERAAFKAKDLTQQLLTFAKGGEPVREAVQLEVVIREMTAFALHGSSVRAEFDLPESLNLADVDKGQVGRVVQNLVLNAAQAMPLGGSIKISADNQTIREKAHLGLPAGDYIRIQISDTGVGIKPEHIGRVFDPYFSTKQAGSGLGLAAAYSIVRKHQGLIDVESTLGQGTTFRIWLPVALASRAAQPVVSAALKSPKGGRVLFMDDEQPIRDMMQILLGKLGMAVETVADGEALIAAYQRDYDRGMPPDLVITDLTVPGGMGGKAAMQRLLEIDPKVKAIVSSGYSSDPVMAHFRDHGFCGFVSKPFQLPELERALAQALASP